MSGRLKRTYELNHLAMLGELDNELVSLDELSRFVEALEIEQQQDAKVRCSLKCLSSSRRQARLTGHVSANVQVECQRCLEPVLVAIDSVIDWKMSSQEDSSEEGNNDFQYVEPPVGLLDWLEDELLLALPQFAKHPQGECGEAAMLKNYSATEEAEVKETSRPFVGLKDLLTKN